MQVPKSQDVRIRKIILECERICETFKVKAAADTVDAVAKEMDVLPSTVEAIARGQAGFAHVGLRDAEVIRQRVARSRRYQRLGMPLSTVSKIIRDHSLRGGRALLRPRSPSNPVTQFLTQPPVTRRHCEPA